MTLLAWACNYSLHFAFDPAAARNALLGDEGAPDVREFSEFAGREMDRRRFLSVAAALGATLGWARRAPTAARLEWRERRDLYPQGVASGDPDEHSVLLWTRRPFDGGATRRPLFVELSLIHI